MSRRSQIVVALLGALVLGLVLAAAASANAFSQVYDSYRNSGRIDPCKFSEGVLNQAKSQVPPDIEQYAPDFPAALDAALQARARGACAPRGSSTAAAVVPAAPPAAPSGGSPASGPAGPPAHAPVATAATVSPTAYLAVSGHLHGGGGGAPAPIIALAVLGGLLAIAAGIYGVARWRGWDPPWVQYLSHAFSEAGFHAEATWAEFADWVRLGR